MRGPSADVPHRTRFRFGDSALDARLRGHERSLGRPRTLCEHRRVGKGGALKARCRAHHLRRGGHGGCAAFAHPTAPHIFPIQISNSALRLRFGATSQRSAARVLMSAPGRPSCSREKVEGSGAPGNAEACEASWAAWRQAARDTVRRRLLLRCDPEKAPPGTPLAAISVRGPALPGGGRCFSAAYPGGFRRPSAPPRPAIEGSPS
jgi:hypothetical protein